MPVLAIYAAILFTLACLFYSVGIWAEFFAKRLKPWHAVAFFLGVIADTIATALMFEHVGALLVNLHTFTGIIGLALMIIHFLWAIIVLRAGKEKALITFHRFSLFVWAIWMAAYLSGVYVGMQRIG